MRDLTLVLTRIHEGDTSASDELLPLVYDELRRLAAHRLHRDPMNDTLQATGLVHEAYIRLVNGQAPVLWSSRGHFFGAAGRAMRRILVERARQHRAMKRQGTACSVDLSHLPGPCRSADILALDEALEALAAHDSQKAELVHLR